MEGQNEGKRGPKAACWPKFPFVPIHQFFFFFCPLGDTVYSSMLLLSGLSTNLNSKVACFIWGNGGGWGGLLNWERK